MDGVEDDGKLVRESGAGQILRYIYIHDQSVRPFLKNVVSPNLKSLLCSDDYV